MGGKSGQDQTIGYRYLLGVHSAMTAGPVDRVTRLRFDKRNAWRGECTGGRITVSAGGLFGGDSREGGVSGDIDIDMGAPDNTQNDYLAAKIGAMVPNFRGVLSAIFRQFYFGMNPYLKTWDMRMQRIFVRGADAREQWYPEKAAIVADTPYESWIDSGVLIATTTYDVAGTFAYAKATHDPDYVIVELVGGGGMESYFSGGTTGGAGAGYAKKRIAASLLAASETVIVGRAGDNGSGGSPDGGTSSFGTFLSATGGMSGCTTSNSVGGSGSGGDVNINGTQGIRVLDGSGLTAWGGDSVLGVHGAPYFGGNPGPGAGGSGTFGVSQVPGGVGKVIVSEYGHATHNLYQSDMNPAHVIRELLTERRGKGEPEANIDNDAFTAAADTLYDESMGFSYEWKRENSLDDFTDDVLRHIDGVLYKDRQTGLWKLYLIRNDYVEADLPVLNEDNARAVTNYKITDPASLVNSVVVKFWNSITGEDAATAPAQDLALIQMLGGINEKTIEYAGFTNYAIASRVCARDLKALSTPLISCTLTVDRTAWNWHKGMPFKLVWAPLDIDVPMRVMSIDFGDSASGAITIECVQDVFGLPEAVTATDPGYGWTSPVNAPAPVVNQIAVEAPYYELVQRLGQDEIDTRLASYPEAGYVIAAGDSPTPDAISARLWVDAGAGYVEAGTVDFSPSAVLTADVGPADTVLPIGSGNDLDRITLGTHAQLGDELVRIDAVSDTALTVGRGCLDTVPVPHASGAVLLAWDQYGGTNSIEYASGETISTKLLTVTGLGVLDIDAAPAASVTLAQRPLRPYPPGNVQFAGAAYPASINGELTFTWSHRDRTLETGGAIVDTTYGDIGPETNVTYTLRLYDETDALKKTVNLMTNNYIWSTEVADCGLGRYNGTIRLELEAWRNGKVSWTKHDITLDRSGYGLNYGKYYGGQ